MGSFDVAQICLNGHVINRSSKEYPEYNKKFCPDCSSPTITACLNCSGDIQGSLKDSMSFSTSKPKAPAYCQHCGHPFPWTLKSLESARLLIEEDELLSQDDKQLLCDSLTDVSANTPATNLAATRFKRIIGKAASTTADGLRQIVVDIASEAARKILFPTGL